MDIPLKIKQMRNNKRMTLAQVGAYIGVGGSAVSAYEQGVSTPPLEKLEKLAELFEVKIEYFTNPIKTAVPESVHDLSATDELIEEFHSTLDFLKKQVDVLNKEKMKLIDQNTLLIEAVLGKKNFPKGSKADVRVIKMYPELTTQTASLRLG